MARRSMRPGPEVAVDVGGIEVDAWVSTSLAACTPKLLALRGTEPVGPGLVLRVLLLLLLVVIVVRVAVSSWLGLVVFLFLEGRRTDLEWLVLDSSKVW
jgi:hypothetical protein